MKMLRHGMVVLIGLMVVLGISPLSWAFDSGSTGTADLVVSSNMTITLPADGVLQYINVTVNSGATLKFNRNANNTPVTILASGNVTVNGSINVDGANGNQNVPGNGGPGGFDGGTGGAAKQYGSRGEGPGGGAPGKPHATDTSYAGGGGGGSFASGGTTGGNQNAGYGGVAGSTYGNSSLIPIIGGSGGGGGGGTRDYYAGGGGGGGGAIIIAASGTINVAGQIYARGGSGSNGQTYSSSWGSNGGAGGSGSGGAIRLIATTITGDGIIDARGGYHSMTASQKYGGQGGDGRVRLEAAIFNRTSQTSPSYSRVIPYAVIPPGVPTLRIQSIGGVAVPSIPKGDFGNADIVLPYETQNPIPITIQAEDVPVGTTVTVKALPSVGDVVSQNVTLEGTLESSIATAELNISTSYPSVIVAQMTYDASVAFAEPFYVDGELVAKITTSISADGRQEMMLITENGREIAIAM